MNTVLGCHSVWMICADVSEEPHASIIRADEFTYPIDAGRLFI